MAVSRFEVSFLELAHLVTLLVTRQISILELVDCPLSSSHRYHYLLILRNHGNIRQHLHRYCRHNRNSKFEDSRGMREPSMVSPLALHRKSAS